MGIGLFRLLLALSVIITHTHPIFNFTLGNPVIAVRSFFVISGFYMALIYPSKYKSKKLFWKNRALRIFPIYWAVLLFTIIVGFMAHFSTGNWGELEYLVKYIRDFNFLTFISVIFSNLFIITRDIFTYSGFNPENGLLIFHKDLYNYTIPAWTFLLVPQAWTLVLELMFYLLAPYLLKLKNYYLILIFILCIILKYQMQAHGFNGPTWTYRFFPTELCYFLFGIFAFKLYSYFNIQKLKLRYIGPIVVSLAIFSLSIFNYIPKYFKISIFNEEWIYYGILAILIPFIFAYSKNMYLDKKIGELSYPVYISHILVNNVVNPLFFVNYVHNPNLQALIVLATSIIFSIFLIIIVQNPIEKIRNRNLLKV